MTFFYPDVAVPSLEIQLCEVFSSMKFVDEIGDEREWVPVLDRVVVQLPVVLARP